MSERFVMWEASVTVALFAVASLLLLAAALATGSVVVRLAAHAKGESWDRLGTQRYCLVRREQRLLAAIDDETCAGCPVQRYLSDRYRT